MLQRFQKRFPLKFLKQDSVALDRPWSSSVEGGVTLQMRFPLKLKARLLFKFRYDFCTNKNDLAFV